MLQEQHGEEPDIIELTDERVNVTGFSSASENSALPITVTFTENGTTKTTGYNVNVTDTVTEIMIKTTPKTAYKYNENLNVSDGTLKVIKGSGTTTVQMQDSMVTGYDKTELGEQTLTVEYGGKTITYTVTVKDYVTGITVSPSTITRKVGDELSSLIAENNIKYVVNYAKAGAQDPNTLLDDMVTGYDKTATISKSLTVTYEDNDEDSFTNGQTFTATLNANFQNTAKEINITLPTKTTYNHGEALNLTGGTIEIVNQDGTNDNVTMTTAMITENGGTVNMSPSSYGASQKVAKTLKITYTKDGVTGTVDYQIEIINNVTMIEMHDKPKLSYNVNESEDLEGGSILVTRATGTPQVISLADSRVSVTGFNSESENSALPITVTFTENEISKTTSYDVNITDSVTEITIKTPPKTAYKYNEDLDVSGGILEVTKGSGKTEEPMAVIMVTGYDKTLLEEQTLTVEYGGRTATYKVTVKDYVTGITVSPGTITRKVGDELSSLIAENSIKYVVNYAKAGAQDPNTLLDDMVTGYDKTATTSESLTVTYEDNDEDSFTNGQTFTATLNANFQNTAKTITITRPTKTTYNHGEGLNLTGGTIEIENQDGTKANVTMTLAMITENEGEVNMSPSSYGDSQKVEKILKIAYTKDGVPGTVDYPIEIVNNVIKIEMHDNPKLSYNVNESEDLEGGSIAVTRAARRRTRHYRVNR